MHARAYRTQYVRLEPSPDACLCTREGCLISADSMRACVSSWPLTLSLHLAAPPSSRRQAVKAVQHFVFDISLGADHRVLTWESAAAVRQWPAQCQRGARSDHNAAMRAPALLHQRL